MKRAADWLAMAWLILFTQLLLIPVVPLTAWGRRRRQRRIDRHIAQKRQEMNV